LKWVKFLFCLTVSVDLGLLNSIDYRPTMSSETISDSQNLVKSDSLKNQEFPFESLEGKESTAVLINCVSVN
ncbi:MAG: hypothetical protein MHPSP_004201, partial [Paramarteilia canceri]